jgi:hypothetical protein
MASSSKGGVNLVKYFLYVGNTFDAEMKQGIGCPGILDSSGPAARASSNLDPVCLVNFPLLR